MVYVRFTNDPEVATQSEALDELIASLPKAVSIPFTFPQDQPYLDPSVDKSTFYQKPFKLNSEP